MFKRKNPESINTKMLNTETINVIEVSAPSKEQMISDIKRQAVLGAASAVGGLVVTGVVSAMTALVKSCSRKRAAKKAQTPVQVVEKEEAQ